MRKSPEGSLATAGWAGIYILKNEIFISGGDWRVSTK
jgi:hypothetical protein